MQTGQLPTNSERTLDRVTVKRRVINSGQVNRGRVIAADKLIEDRLATDRLAADRFIEDGLGARRVISSVNSWTCKQQTSMNGSVVKKGQFHSMSGKLTDDRVIRNPRI